MLLVVGMLCYTDMTMLKIWMHMHQGVEVASHPLDLLCTITHIEKNDMRTGRRMDISRSLGQMCDARHTPSKAEQQSLGKRTEKVGRRARATCAPRRHR